MYLPGAGSDHASFIFYAGVPVIDTSFDPVSFLFQNPGGGGPGGYLKLFPKFYGCGWDVGGSIVVDNSFDPVSFWLQNPIWGGGRKGALHVIPFKDFIKFDHINAIKHENSGPP